MEFWAEESKKREILGGPAERRSCGRAVLRKGGPGRAAQKKRKRPKKRRRNTYGEKNMENKKTRTNMGTLMRLSFSRQSGNEKSECSCEPSVRELRAQREQRIMYDRIPAQFVESVPGPKTKLKAKYD